MRAVKERANAKINLYLDVIALREDGFHDIKTVMHSVSLADELTVTYTPSAVTNVTMSVKGCRYLPTDEKNLAVRAAHLYLKYACITASINIKLEKNIPVAAGLAGGSSDAAATLRAMNRLFGRMFADKVLYKMAAELGSDVPFCLYGKTALCEGRGDIITKLPDTLKLDIVVAIDNERVSTPRAYAALDNLYAYFDGSVKTDGDKHYAELMRALHNGDISGLKLFNIFEAAVLPTCPGAVELRRRLLELGADSVLMSGSGPSVFGIFGDRSKAKAACSALRSQNLLAYVAESI